MNKFFLSFFIIFSVLFVNAQSPISKQFESSDDRFPVFSICSNLQGKELEECFYNEVQQIVYHNFQVPEYLKKSQYSGVVKVLFEVDATGKFKVIVVNSNNEDLITETKKVFLNFPKIAPPTYNGTPTYSKFNLKIAIPLVSPEENAAVAKVKK